MLQAAIAADRVESSERVGRVLARATWALVFVTATLVAATVVLTAVTARQ